MSSLGKIVLLGLEYEKYYVHYTEQDAYTIESIAAELDSTKHWIKCFQIVEILEVIENISEDEIDNYTIQYMQKYGIANVRSNEYLYTDRNSLDKIHYKSVLEQVVGPTWRKIYSDIQYENFHGLADPQNDTQSVDEKYRNGPFLTRAVDEKYRNGPFLCVDYYNKTKRCECCLRKDMHMENCCYRYIRKLPADSE